jgi:hypothetical protein
MRNFRGGWLAVILAFVIGALLGGGVASSMNEPRLSGLPTIGVGGGPVDSNLQLNLNNALIEHGVLASNHLQAIYDGKDVAPTSNALNNNSEKIADLFVSAYGESIRSDFLSMWRDHINGYVDYTNALKNNDTAMQNQSRQNLANTATNIGNHLNKIDSNIPAQEVTDYMNGHIDTTLGVIESYSAKDQSRMVSEMTDATNQASQFAQFLAQKISASSQTD